MEEENKPVEVRPKVTDSGMSVRRYLRESRDSPYGSGTGVRHLDGTVTAESIPQRTLMNSRFDTRQTSLLKLTLTLVAALSCALTAAVLVIIEYSYALPLALPLVLVCLVEGLNVVLISTVWMVAPRER